MARFAIPSHKAYGVSMTTMRPLIKRLGKNHELAAALWEADRHETRILAALVDDPALVTPTQMNRWCRDFDSWAVCDAVCFHLFDRTPHAFRKVDQWAARRDEFVKRAAFALLASLALHDKKASDDEFLRLPLIEQAASDGRNFVKKAVNWALRQIGKRNLALNAAAVVVAQRLATSAGPTVRWVGKDALRELTSAAVAGRFARKRGA
jgi:3-methyladenine DNA glycosylase AlkD